MTKKLGLRGAAIAAVLMALPALAAAQDYPPPGGGGPPAMGPQRDEQGFWQRRGLYGGVGLGFGNMVWDCDFCDETNYESIGFHFNIGWKLNKQLGIFLDGWGLAAPTNNVTGDDGVLTHAVSTVGVQFWLTQPFWLKGGLGLAQWSYSDDFFDETSDTAPAILLAGGFELLSSPNFSLDVEGRIGAGNYDAEVDGGRITNIGIQFSINWHSLWGGAVVVVH